MAVLIWGVTIVLLSFAVHVALWRMRLPRRQTRALLLIFSACLILSLWSLSIAQGWDGCPRWVPLPMGIAQYVHIAILVAALALAYVTTYSAVEVDSPSLLIVLAIARAGREGLEKARFEQQFSDDVLVRPRIRDLVRDGMVAVDHGRHSITQKGRRFVAIMIAYRTLLGAGKGG